MTPDDFEALIPLAAELIGSVRDYGPEVTADVLARVPNGRHDALAVVLAAMVDPDAKPSELLAWLCTGPVQSRSWESPVHRPELRMRCCPECGSWITRNHIARHRRTMHGEAA